MSVVLSTPAARALPATAPRPVKDDAPFQGLLVPGLHGSDERHWQSRWRQHMPWLHELKMEDWQRPDPALWESALERALAPLPEPAVLIAHSFGCLACAGYAARRPDRVAGLLLVAPACPEPLTLDDPSGPLPVPARVIASTTDPWMTLDDSRALARRWGAAFRNGGDLGHINTASGIGEWRQGLEDLRWLLTQRTGHA
ncbi:alpha/beta fold hydrolase [Alcanivorax marinus]|uniref:Alpha/beta fold hydrolase n=1 Tax=Alloalcanivorax marinus TaxID=1177169 RepID=A0A9Q3YNX3_9GAMM|nr:alpha/beta fold hydrolase [Alloalcanivorax marinus]MCC4309181.1 alpha/beta fold hydrolase [Alloalcanivorax marinus]